LKAALGIAMAGSLLLAASAWTARAHEPVLWKDNDDLPIAEPAEDHEGDAIWWDGVRNMALYPLGKVLDLGQLAHTVGEVTRIVGPTEAANVNALDEVPDSTWFTNRHARRRLSTEALAQGPNVGRPPAADGPLVVLSGKALGMTPGFVMRDAKQDTYVVKFDAPDYPDLATGAELVCSKIMWALGWNVPEYYLFELSERRLTIAPHATGKDSWGRKVPITTESLHELLKHAYRLPNGKMRVLTSRYVPGKTKGSPPLIGVRGDDPNDTVDHQDRRELRGLRTVAAFISFTDGRRGNFLDTFVPDSKEPGSAGHMVHYVLDFSSGFGAGNVDYKDPKLGHEYFFDPPKVALRALTLWQLTPDWARLPLTHPMLGYFESATFDPDEWKPTYLNPAFDRATLRDRFWGAKLVTSLTDEDLRIVAHTGAWEDARVEPLLTAILVDRRQRIARAYFDWLRINPIDGFAVDGSWLRFENLAVASGIVDRSVVRYRYRMGGREWALTSDSRVPIPAGDEAAIEIATSHDAGERWSPPARVTVATIDGVLQAAELERVTR
jgi:hypothetical protein